MGIKDRPTTRRSWLTTTAIMASMAGLTTSVEAQVVLDGTVGPSGQLDGPDYQITDDLGSRAGGNLFHSFRDFAIQVGESVTFSGPDNVDNVISRVTGSEPSDINGTLRSTIPDADFYLINPNGVTFGPQAELDVQGSFHVSTGDTLSFSDGRNFSATDPDSSGLSVAEPRMFGFYDMEPGAIFVNGSRLELDEGETLSLVGGDIEVGGQDDGSGGGDLRAPGGTIALLGVGPGGTAAIETGAVEATTLKNVVLIDEAVVDVGGDDAGSIIVSADRLILDNAAQISSAHLSASTTDHSIDLRAESIEISGSSTVRADVGGAGDGADIQVSGRTLSIAEGSSISTTAYGDGATGSITIDVDDVQIVGATNTSSHISSSVGTNSAGVAGAININAGDLMLRDGGMIAGGMFGSGEAGDVSIRAEDMRITGNGGPEFTGIDVGTSLGSTGNGGHIDLAVRDLHIIGGRTGIVSQSRGIGRSGDIKIDTSNLEIHNEDLFEQAGISSFSSTSSIGGAGNIDIVASRVLGKGNFTITATSEGPGDAGDVSIVSDALSMTGTGLFGQSSIASNGASLGNSGAIALTAHEIEFDDGFVVDTTAVFGRTGAIAISGDRIAIRGASTVSSLGAFNIFQAEEEVNGGISIHASDRIELVGSPNGNSIIISATIGSTGSGNILLESPNIYLGSNSLIDSSTLGNGDAGAISIHADNLELDFSNASTPLGINSSAGDPAQFPGGSILSPSSLNVSSSNAPLGTVGGAGDPTQLVGSNAIVPSSLTGSAGSILIDAGNITLKGNSSTAGGVISTSTFTNGDGGTIDIVTDNIALIGGSVITSTSFGNGIAGNISIDASQSLSLLDDSIIRTESTLSGGGQISLAAGQIIDINESNISTSVLGDASVTAGNIQFLSSNIMIIDQSNILANAQGGRGGNISVLVGDRLQSPNSLLEASGLETGTITVTARDQDVAGQIAILENQLADASRLLRERCESGGDLAGSSFGIQGKSPAVEAVDRLLRGLYAPFRIAEEDPVKIAEGPMLVEPCS